MHDNKPIFNWLWNTINQSCASGCSIKSSVHQLRMNNEVLHSLFEEPTDDRFGFKLVHWRFKKKIICISNPPVWFVQSCMYLLKLVVGICWEPKSWKNLILLCKLSNVLLSLRRLNKQRMQDMSPNCCNGRLLVEDLWKAHTHYLQACLCFCCSFFAQNHIQQHSVPSIFMRYLLGGIFVSPKNSTWKKKRLTKPQCCIRTSFLQGSR